MLDQFVYLLNNHFTQQKNYSVSVYLLVLLKDWHVRSAFEMPRGVKSQMCDFLLRCVISEHITFRNLISTKRGNLHQDL